MIAWLTGLPASGKSTLARRVRELAPCVVLDSDEVRDALGARGYEADDRDAFYRALGELALLLERQGIAVIVAATGARRAHRDAVRARAAHFAEVHVDASLEDCEARDPKGLYARARAGTAATLPGVGVAYEPPLEPELVARGGLDDDAAHRIAALVSHRSRGA